MLTSPSSPLHHAPILSVPTLPSSSLDDFKVWATDDYVSRFCTWDTYTNKEDVLNYLKEKVLPHPWIRAICIDDHPIGAISIVPGPSAIDAKGQGIATVVVKMVINTIFSEWPHLERLEAIFSLLYMKWI
ncbi:hypothetical protein CKAN_02038000 [Cinnamomum micranthum f. kanehirae]|uniref:N-acetyltransferase domain-containing protein n=1 Tax=Cinnamomum micranthum f. kanehirae TaxID=337451 RepID=A0A443PKE0_9MAGN|nr:hypothetical protein CKAN_02038000 [Cinnamomum micranthum f. kanehirae]